MVKPRKEQIDIENIATYYFITCNCARKSWLCGYDPQTGYDYEHRKHRLQARIHYLNSVFAIDVAGYSVMSNHYHLLLHVNRKLMESWSNQEVVDHWLCLFKAYDKPFIHRWNRGETLTQAEQRKVDEEINKWRERLIDPSWFMRCLNQPIATEANHEDGMRGYRFWEPRFDSQAVQTEADLLACLSYIDLNPVYACIADTPESSDYTSFQERLRQHFVTTDRLAQGVPETQANLLAKYNVPVKPLMPFKGGETAQDEWGLPFSFEAYQELVDWLGRAQRFDKPGSIDEDMPPILERLQTDKRLWINAASQFNSTTHHRRLKKYQIKQNLPILTDS